MDPTTELAWAAGFFDGEGHTGIQKPHYLLLQISQNDREPLDRFLAAVGVGKVYGPYNGPARRAQGSRPHFLYYARRGEAQAVLDALRPYLTTRKRQQADAAVRRAR